MEDLEAITTTLEKGKSEMKAACPLSYAKINPHSETIKAAFWKAREREKKTTAFRKNYVTEVLAAP